MIPVFILESEVEALAELPALALTDAAQARLLASCPGMTLKVILAIHWQAMRLWLKGAPFRRPPRAEDERDGSGAQVLADAPRPG